MKNVSAVQLIVKNINQKRIVIVIKLRIILIRKDKELHVYFEQSTDLKFS